MKDTKDRLFITFICCILIASLVSLNQSFLFGERSKLRPGQHSSTSFFSSTIVNEDFGFQRAQRSIEDVEDVSESFKNAFNSYLSSHGKSSEGIVLLSPVGQLSNRIMSIVSALLFCMLTNYSVYFDFRYNYYSNYDDLFEPIQNFEYGREFSFNLFNGQPRDPDYLLSMYESRNVKIETLETMLGCMKLTPTSTKKEIKYMVISSNQYFVPLLAHNPVFHTSIQSWFPDGDIFGPIARRLFRPNKLVRSMVEEFKKSVHWDDHIVIGLQMRNGGDFAERPLIKEDWISIASAAKQMVMTIRELDKTKANKPYAYFLATDTASSRLAAKKYLPLKEENVWEYGEFQKSDDVGGIQQALVDLTLLSETDDLIVTAYSTYGYFASSLTRKRPVIFTSITKHENNLISVLEEKKQYGVALFNGVNKSFTTLREGFARSVTTEPCFHFLGEFPIEQMMCYNETPANSAFEYTPVVGRNLYASNDNWLENEMRFGRYC
jgi:hypothetical protein